MTQYFVYLQITYSTASVESRSENLIHLVPSAKYEAKAIADVIWKFNWTLVNIISSGENYFSHQRVYLEEELKQRSVCIAKRVQLMRRRRQADIRKTVSRLKGHQLSRVTVLLVDTTTAAKIFQEARIQKLKSYLWIGGQSWSENKDLLEEYSDVIKRSLGVSLIAKRTGQLKDHLDEVLSRTTTCSLFNLGIRHPTFCKNNDIIPRQQNYKFATSNTMTNATNISVLKNGDFIKVKGLSLEGSSRIVDSVFLIAQTLREARRQNDFKSRTMLVTNSSTMRLDFETMCSKLFTRDKNGDIIGQYRVTNFKDDKKGKLQPIPVGFWQYTTKSSKRLSLGVKDVSLPKHIDNVDISRCSPNCRPGTFVKKNHAVCCWRCKKCPKGTYSTTFRSGVCLRCSENQMPNLSQTGCQNKPENYLGFKDISSSVLLVACVLGESTTLFVVIIFVKFLNTPVVKASNMMYSFFILVVLFVWFTMPVFFVGRPTNSTCALRVLSPPILYTAVSAALLTKTKRLIRIFSTLKKKHRFLSNAWFGCLAGALISVHFVLGLLYLLKFPPTILIDSNHDDRIIVECSHNLALDVVASVYNAVLCITGAYLAFSSRSLPQHYNEARHICVVMFLFLVSWAALLITQYGQPDGKLKSAIISFTLIAGAYSVLFFIFLPKLRVILFRPEKNTMRATLEGTRRYSVDVAANIDVPMATFDGRRRHTSPACLPADMAHDLMASAMPSHLSLGCRVPGDPLMKTIDEVCHFEQVAITLKEQPKEEMATK